MSDCRRKAASIYACRAPRFVMFWTTLQNIRNSTLTTVFRSSLQIAAPSTSRIGSRFQNRRKESRNEVCQVSSFQQLEQRE